MVYQSNPLENIDQDKYPHEKGQFPHSLREKYGKSTHKLKRDVLKSEIDENKYRQNNDNIDDSQRPSYPEDPELLPQEAVDDEFLDQTESDQQAEPDSESAEQTDVNFNKNKALNEALNENLDSNQYNFELGMSDVEKAYDPYEHNTEVTKITSYVDATPFKRSFVPDINYIFALTNTLECYNNYLFDADTERWFESIQDVIRDLAEAFISVNDEDIVTMSGVSIAQAYDRNTFKPMWDEKIQNIPKEKIFGAKGVLNFMLCFLRAKNAYAPLQNMDNEESTVADYGLKEGSLALVCGQRQNNLNERKVMIEGRTNAQPLVA